MKRNFISIAALLCLSIVINAQQKLTIEQAVTGNYREFKRADLTGLKWKAEGEQFTWVDQYKNLLAENVNSGETAAIVTLDELNAVLKQKNADTLAYLYNYSWSASNKLQIENGNNFLVFDVEQDKIDGLYQLPDTAQNIDYCEKASTVAYTVGNNLHIMDSRGNDVAITMDKNPGIVNGQIVSRNEFGINTGTFWSPAGHYLAFYRKDETQVTNYPLVNVNTRIATVENVKYPMAGMKSEHVSLGVFNPATGRTVFIERDSLSDKYLTCVTWSPDEKYVYIAVLNREQNHMKFKKYDVATGKLVKILFEEKSDKYVEPLNAAYFLHDGESFIWQSRRDGFNHLYLYDTEGNLIKQVTKGDWLVTELLGTDPADKYVFYQSTNPSPLGRQIYKTSLKSGKTYRLTEEAGTHEVQVSPDYNYMLDRFESMKVPNRIDLLSQKGKLVRNVLDAPNPFKDFTLPEAEIVNVTAADGKTKLYGRLIKPADFDSTKKYPVVVYVYGGPHVQLITNTWLAGARLWQYYMAQHGYVVFTLDNRGSANRGLHFENIIHRQVGTNEIADQMEGVKYLKSLPYVDQDRMGIHGWSFGGFMTISMMLREPGTFKVAVAGGPVIDWKYYEVMYGERYMDTPQENPEGYETASLLNYVDNLEGKLLIIHGAIDHTVVWQNSLRFLEKCVKERKQVDYFVYPRHEHNVRGLDRIHLMEKVTGYFDDFL